MEIHDLKLSRFILLLFTAAVPLFGAGDGYVVKVESATVYLDWGKSSGVAVGDEFEVYRPGESLKHPVTGENLGQARKVIGKGVLLSIDEKFSQGKVVDAVGTVRAGDRTSHTARIFPLPPEPGKVHSGGPAQASAPTATTLTPVPQELWRSQPIKSEASGIAVGDLDADGKKEVIVAFRDRIEVFRWNNQALESVGIYQDRTARNFLAVDVADHEGQGRDRVFATLFIEGNKRARTLVLEWQDGKLQQVGRFDGFSRSFDRMGGKRDLIWQDASMARELRIRQPSYVVKKDKKYSDGDGVKLPRALNEDQLFGYTWGDWDGDGSEDFAFLQGGERLRLLFKDAKWSSGNVYGGSRTDFNWEGDQIGSVYLRLVNRPTADGKSQLLVPYNIQLTPVKFARLKLYKQSELIALGWNGLEMIPQWRIPVAGALSDFALADAMGTGRPQVWITAVGTGNRTVLLAYQLP